MPALHRAIALAQVNHVAICVGKYLNLDVARLDDGFLEDQLARARRVLRFGAGRLQRRR